MKRVGSRIANYDWRRLITVVCLSAFVLLTICHAGHCFAQPTAKTTWSMAAADGTDHGAAAGAESVCQFCVQIAEELTFVALAGHNPHSVRVETVVSKLSTRPIPAEFPPPIA
ncbi:hypothetical protein CQ14_24555 [Bradyrhizobium lablabi]|uniref:DUF2946 domain-containing protein n=1 Tax=Bradyrhizobium lablabi TaxID=722472 RepID=A0A0R3ME76_9BRAD|nr:hypothetical protein [Bradyrhizobium lablabi]KRR18567.1 hypothetical protein CQ14_24555 [Bradyrhizobium lablabi]